MSALSALHAGRPPRRALSAIPALTPEPLASSLGGCNLPATATSSSPTTGEKGSYVEQRVDTAPIGARNRLRDSGRVGHSRASHGDRCVRHRPSEEANT
jgi:hypothetical protein